MNTTSKGDALELSVYGYFEDLIRAEQFICRSSCCKIFLKKGYYSRDRGSEIVFDVSIEIYLPGATDYSEVWLIECKNYSHPVPVNDVEEFYAKVQQVLPTGAKPVMVSNAAFQTGARNFAQAKKMGILRYLPPSDVKWELYRSPSASTPTGSGDTSEGIMRGLCSQEFRGAAFDLYMQSPAGLTNSLWDFAEGMLSASRFTASQLHSMRNPRDHQTHQVPFVEQAELEERAIGILQDIGYRGGPVPLDEICSREAEACGLKVITEASPVSSGDNTALGRISFSPLEIVVYQQPVPNTGRQRFTLAHELAHHLLSHGKYMAAESCDEGDFSLRRDGSELTPDIARMEYQANILASCLLMPRACFIGDFRRIAQWLHLPNRRFGELFLDSQPCNYQNYLAVTRELMERYGVSRAATTIRLESLGLLKDVRSFESRPAGLTLSA